MQKGECEMNTPEQGNCASVSAERQAQQAQEPRPDWGWVETAVWRVRMLKALEEGVKGNRWFRLIDKVWADRTLQRAWERVSSNGGSPGMDGVSVERFEKECQSRLLAVKERLKTGTYEPKPVKRVWIEKLGSREKRPLGIPTVTDRIVQTALRNVIEPIFEKDFAEQSYGFRPGRGCKDALRRVDKLLKEGRAWVVDADIKAYFDTIPHDRLMKLVEQRIADGRVLELIRGYLKQGVMDGLSHNEAGESGTPQGAVISPLLANIYLAPLDQNMADHGCEMVRYADDFIILCRTREEAEGVLKAVQQWTAEAGLTLHPEKTRIVDATQPGGFDFLGYHFELGRKTPRKKSLEKFQESIRSVTRRTSGQSMKTIISELTPKMRGWFE